jgi:septum formation protein
MVKVGSKKLILASGSPRRRQLLSEAGFEFEVIVPTIPEPEGLVTMTPAQQAEALAYFKARTIADANKDACVLGADTIVALGDQIYGKPRDAAHARAMLESLSHSRHQVITGVALLEPGGKRTIASETTHVTMRPMLPREIDEYIESGEWISKAGAYAIQETADRFVVRTEGSFTNIIGLPMELTEKLLAGVSIVPITCENA